MSKNPWAALPKEQIQSDIDLLRKISEHTIYSSQVIRGLAAKLNARTFVVQNYLPTDIACAAIDHIERNALYQAIEALEIYDENPRL